MGTKNIDKRTMAPEEESSEEPKIPVFTVVKNGAILKNIFVINNDKHPPLSSSSMSLFGSGPKKEDGEDVLIVGRHPACNIVLMHPSVSRFHLQINAIPLSRKLLVTDLSSVHGTWVSGKKVEPGFRAELNEGDTIRVGGSTRVYRLHWVPLSRAYDTEYPLVSTSDLAMIEEKEEDFAEIGERNEVKISQNENLLGPEIERFEEKFSLAAVRKHEEEENQKKLLAPEIEKFEEKCSLAAVKKDKEEEEEEENQNKKLLAPEIEQFENKSSLGVGRKEKGEEEEEHQAVDNHNFEYVKKEEENQNQKLLAPEIERFEDKSLLAAGRKEKEEEEEEHQAVNNHNLESVKKDKEEEEEEEENQDEKLLALEIKQCEDKSSPAAGRKEKGEEEQQDVNDHNLELVKEEEEKENQNEKLLAPEVVQFEDKSSLPAGRKEKGEEHQAVNNHNLESMKKHKEEEKENQNEKLLAPEVEHFDDKSSLAAGRKEKGEQEHKAVNNHNLESMKKHKEEEKENQNEKLLAPEVEHFEDKNSLAAGRKEKGEEEHKAFDNHNLESAEYREVRCLDLVLESITSLFSDEISGFDSKNEFPLSPLYRENAMSSSKFGFSPYQDMIASSDKENQTPGALQKRRSKGLTIQKGNLESFNPCRLSPHQDMIASSDKENQTPGALQKRKSKGLTIQKGNFESFNPCRLSPSKFGLSPNLEIVALLGKENQKRKLKGLSLKNQEERDLVLQERRSERVPLQLLSENSVGKSISKASLKNQEERDPVLQETRSERVPLQLLSANSGGKSISKVSFHLNARSSSSSVASSQTLEKKVDHVGVERRRWTMVADTTTLLDKKSRKSLQLLEGLKGTRLIIPRTVIRELDCLKRCGSFFRRTIEASVVLESLEECTAKTKWWIHVQKGVEEGRPSAATPPASPESQMTEEIVSPTAEEHILDCALLYKRLSGDEQVVLLSNDTTLKIKAIAEGLICETANEFRDSLVNPFCERFMWAESSPRGRTWSVFDDVVLKERFYKSPSKKSLNGEGGKGLKLILSYIPQQRQDQSYSVNHVA